MGKHYVYILRCSDDTLYTGYTTDLCRRLWEHNNSPRGAKYTRCRRPCKMVYSECYETRSEATRREYQIKCLSRGNKLKLIGGITMKLFISQPMKGLSNEDIQKAREDVINKYPEYEIIDSFFIGAPHDAKPLWFLGKAIELLSTADAAIFLDGWKKSRGCKIEHYCAKEYGITILDD